MPLYTYQIINPDGTEGETFDIIQPMSASPLTFHPELGLPVKRVYHAPLLSTRYGPKTTAAKLDTKNVDKAGFTKYVRDKSTNTYHRVAGKEGPSTFKLQK